MGLFDYKVLKERHIEDTARLYSNAAAHVEYYTKMYGKNSCSADIYVNFKQDVAESIRKGLCVGFFDEGDLTGALLAIDWYEYEDRNRAALDHMFLPELKTTQDIKTVMHRTRNKSYFIYAVLVEKGLRGRGIATHMLQTFMKKVGKSTIVTDCVYENANAMWENNGFTIETVSEELKLAIRK